MAPLPIALATSSPERRQRNLARGIAETLDDSIELARRFRERHGAGRPHVGGVRAPVAATLDDSKRLAERFSERTRHDIATTLEESRQLAERWRARTAPSVARTLAESYDLARRFQRGQLRPAEPYRPPLPQGRPLLPRTLDDSLAFAARRPTATTSASLADAKAAAARFGARSQAANARYNVSELVKGPLLRGPDAVVEEPQGPTLRTRGGTGPGAGGTKPLLIDEPVTFKNALWTEYPVVLVKQFEYIAYVEFVDIAAGGGYVWAVSSFHDVYVLRPGSPAFERADGAPAATRVAVLSDGSPVVVTPNHRIEIGRRAGEHWIDLSLYSSLAQSPVSAIDVGAGDAQDDYPYGQIAVTLMDGRVFSFQHGFVPVDGGITIAAIALARNGAPRTRSSDGAPLYTLWAVGDNGDLFVGPGWQYADGFPIQVEALRSVPAPFAAADVGVDNQGVAFVSGSSGDAWQLDTFGNRWLDTRGKAKAIAAGPDGSMWIVGQDGTIYNRGGRSFGFWEFERRTRPRADPHESWCEYAAETPAPTFATVSKNLQSFLSTRALPPILSEAVGRFVEGGATTVRLSQSFSDPAKPVAVGAALQLVIAAVLGIDVFLLIDIVRTGARIVPKGSVWEDKPFSEMIDDFNAFFDKFVDSVNNLFAGNKLPQRFEDVVKYLSVGGEVDIYVYHRPSDQWPEWITFYHGVGAHIRASVPRVKIGSVTSLHGDNGFSGAAAYFDKNHPESSPIRLLNAASDFAGFTSYPEQTFELDDPATTTSQPVPGFSGAERYNYSVAERISQALQIAGDLPVVMEEFGYPTYDQSTIDALSPDWPSHDFPPSFYAQPSRGEAAQATAVDLAFQAWGGAGMRLPLFIWFTDFEMHIEGRGCNPRVGWMLPDNADPTYFKTNCNPCSNGVDDANCHACGPGEGIDWLGTGVDERGERFYGSCGLIRSNGEPKAAWSNVLLQTALRRIPRGG